MDSQCFCQRNKRIKIRGAKAIVVDMENHSTDEILVHDETNLELSINYIKLDLNPDLPEPIGATPIDKPTYNQDMLDQIENAKMKKGWESSRPLNAGDTWKVS